MADKRLELPVETDWEFDSYEEAEAWPNTPEFVELMKRTYGRDLPLLFTCKIKGQLYIGSPIPTRQGIPMDWRFYAEYDQITPRDIEAEQNAAKRYLLMMEYGISNYLKDTKVLSKDSYGTLIEARVDGGVSETEEVSPPQRFVIVKDGTIVPKHKRGYYRKRNVLTEDNRILYYIPVPQNTLSGQPIDTAKKAVEFSWKLNQGTLPEKGWDFEA